MKKGVEGGLGDGGHVGVGPSKDLAAQEDELGAAGVSDVPVVVAFADFDPPASHESQMLSIRTGDEVFATGQDGQGWWYGRKRDGTEGWFPPSYVQLKDEVDNAARGVPQGAPGPA